MQNRIFLRMDPNKSINKSINKSNGLKPECLKKSEYQKAYQKVYQEVYQEVYIFKKQNITCHIDKSIFDIYKRCKQDKELGEKQNSEKQNRKPI